MQEWNGKTSTVTSIATKYGICENTLWQWKKNFDGTPESLQNKSSVTHTPHPRSHTAEEIANIEKVLNDNPNVGYKETYNILATQYNYNRNERGFNKWIVKRGYSAQIKRKPKIDDNLLEIELILRRFVPIEKIDYILELIKQSSK